MRVQVRERQRCRVRICVRGLLRFGAGFGAELVLGMETVECPGYGTTEVYG